MPQLGLVSLGRLAQARESVAVLGNDQEVDRGLGADVTERQRIFVLVDYCCWDLRNQAVPSMWRVSDSGMAIWHGVTRME